MVSLRSALSAVAMAVSTAAITVNVYSDGDCTQYATSFNPVENGCYNWDWEGSNSDLVTDWLNGCKNCCNSGWTMRFEWWWLQERFLPEPSTYLKG
ncbi:hypothetical protein ACKAV7_008473 [Fusarium commune]